MIFGEYLEEVGISLDSGCLYRLLSILNDRLPEEGHMRDRLYFRNIHLKLLLVPVAQAQVLVRSEHECTLPVRRLVRHLVLLHHIASD